MHAHIKSGTTTHGTGKHIAPASQPYMGSSLAHPEITETGVWQSRLSTERGM